MVPKLELEISDVTLARVTALALARNEPADRILAEVVESFAASGKTRLTIRRARRKDGNLSLADLGWLDGYSGQSFDELMSYEGLETPIGLLLAIEEAILQRIKREGVNWTGVERTLLSVMALHREVNNGGCEQFFRNSSLKFGSSIVDDLKRIGCNATAPIARKAVAALGIRELTPLKIRSTMDVPDEKRRETLHECNEAFYKLNEIPAQLFAYVRENPGGIRI
jgi:hypothetical protein